MSTEETEVLVVGGGPAGLTLAAELSHHEVNTILIEKSLTTSNTPKAVALNSRTMEHFRMIGLEKKIQDASYPRDMRVNLAISTATHNVSPIFHAKFMSWGELAEGVQGLFPFYQAGSSVCPPMLCPQFTSEATIRKHLDETSTRVKMFWGWRVLAISENEDGVTAKAVNADGEEKLFKARYLVGCDGGTSFVRKTLGIHTFGKFVVARACTISFRSPQLMEHQKREGITGFVVLVNPQIFGLAILLNADGDFAFHIFMSSSASDEEVQWYVRNPKKAVEYALGTDDIAFDIQYVSGYNMHALISTKFKEGRCLLAGDSAHQWLPAGGLGLNTGIADVGNLSWKLAAMVKGYGGEHLLDSYEIERRPLADTTRRFALDFGGFLFPGNNVINFVRNLTIKNSLARLFLQRFGGAALTRAFLSGIDLILGFQYSNSSIIAHQYNEDGSVRLHCNPPDSFMPSSLPGCRAPHVVLPELPTILDLFGKDFVLLIIGGVESDLKELKEVMTKKEVPFSTHTYPPLSELTQLYDCKYFLVRPDGVVAWRSDYQPSTAESARIMACVLGHTPPSRLPPPITVYGRSMIPTRVGFVRDLIVRASVVGGLSYFSVLPFWQAGLVGVGLFVLLRAISVRPPPHESQSFSRHKAALVTKYGDADSVLQIEPKHVGKFGPDDVLIRVRAASVTEMDLSMRKGLGSSTYQKLAKLSVGGPYFPLILGRGCSGEVAAVGCDVTEFLPGDQVYAAIPPSRQGAHAQLVAVPEDLVSFKPDSVEHKEAASLPWAAMTAWSALVRDAGINKTNARGKKVLVHGGTGGVGSFAVQLLKAWGADVTTTCDVENTALAHHLGADKVLDVQTGDYSAVLRGYDVVLDLVGGKSERTSLSTLKFYGGSVYVCVTSPREQLVDSLGGFLGGVVFSTLYRFKVVFNRLFGGRGFYYSSPALEGGVLEDVRALVEQGAVRPLIEAVYSLDEVVAAHKHMETGQSRGNVVVTVN